MTEFSTQAHSIPEYGQQPKVTLPKSTSSLVCGILSIPFAGLIGIILAIVAITQANDAIHQYEMNPDRYLLGGYKNAKAGKVCGTIGIVLTVVLWLFLFMMAAS